MSSNAARKPLSLLWGGIAAKHLLFDIYNAAFGLSISHPFDDSSLFNFFQDTEADTVVPSSILISNLPDVRFPKIKHSV
ncbi:hypothetical protein AAK899_10980, partial [Erysipelotrichaceae bacterium 51-3]